MKLIKKVAKIFKAERDYEETETTIGDVPLYDECSFCIAIDKVFNCTRWTHLKASCASRKRVVKAIRK
jgi:hypothetical protein